MKFIKTDIPDVYIIEPSVFGDNRGYFFESFNKEAFEESIGTADFVQDNESKSSLPFLVTTEDIFLNLSIRKLLKKV